MTHHLIRRLLFLSLLGAVPVLPVLAMGTSQGHLAVTRMADGLDAPWGFGFLPDGSVLITERDGVLWRLTEAKRHRVEGIAEVAAKGQGGLLDVMIPRDFATSREVFFTYAKWQADGSGTAVGAARLSEDGQQLENWRELFELTPGSSGGRHYGSRIVEAPDGTLFVTIGERGDRPSAQDLSRENGSVIRINRDGSIPVDNPFVDEPGIRPAIWSYGHRNPQGAGLDLGGNLWVSEHGARGGDEVNAVRKGANYGWPVISYGRHYSGAKIGEGTGKEGMEQPEFYWDPSIAPSGLMVYFRRALARVEGRYLCRLAQVRLHRPSGRQPADRSRTTHVRRDGARARHSRSAGRVNLVPERGGRRALSSVAALGHALAADKAAAGRCFLVAGTSPQWSFCKSEGTKPFVPRRLSR